MRWNIPVPERRFGDVDYVRRFAILPVKMADNSKIWLEFYLEKRVWTDSHQGPYWLPVDTINYAD